MTHAYTESMRIRDAADAMHAGRWSEAADLYDAIAGDAVDVGIRQHAEHRARTMRRLCESCAPEGGQS